LSGETEDSGFEGTYIGKTALSRSVLIRRGGFCAETFVQLCVLSGAFGIGAHQHCPRGKAGGLFLCRGPAQNSTLFELQKPEPVKRSREITKTEKTRLTPSVELLAV